mmetsp:Transcript_5099/g.18309  ORF Transcript_5099/g.18309 Transcript_5099/m.18309 type:complete len:230 (+) Transcript_5099:445-1134(+)
MNASPASTHSINSSITSSDSIVSSCSTSVLYCFTSDRSRRSSSDCTSPKLISSWRVLAKTRAALLQLLPSLVTTSELSTHPSRAELRNIQSTLSTAAAPPRVRSSSNLPSSAMPTRLSTSSSKTCRTSTLLSSSSFIVSVSENDDTCECEICSYRTDGGEPKVCSTRAPRNGQRGSGPGGVAHASESLRECEGGARGPGGSAEKEEEMCWRTRWASKSPTRKRCMLEGK